MFSFENSLVGIPIMVLEELDTFKTESTQRGFNSREVIRHLRYITRQRIISGRDPT